MNYTGAPKVGRDGLPFIIALDFDGLMYDEGDFPGVGQELEYLDYIKLVQFVFPDAKYILWTCRTGEALDNAIEACIHTGIRLDAINDNIPEVIEMYGTNARKIRYHACIDDRNVVIDFAGKSITYSGLELQLQKRYEQWR